MMEKTKEENVIIKELTPTEKTKLNKEIETMKLSQIEKQAIETTQESFYKLKDKNSNNKKDSFLEENVIIKELTPTEKKEVTQEIEALKFNKIEEQVKEITEESFYKTKEKIWVNEKDSFLEENLIIKELTPTEKTKLNKEIETLKLSKVEEQVKEITEEWHL